MLLPVVYKDEEPNREEARGASLGTVLVVDDETAVRDFIAEVLGGRGYRVLKASDGREALSIFERENGAVEAVVLDVVMPVMGGNELLSEIKNRESKLKILLTSGYTEIEAMRLCDGQSGAAFIQKPYTAQQITDAVDKLLGVNNGIAGVVSPSGGPTMGPAGRKAAA